MSAKADALAESIVAHRGILAQEILGVGGGSTEYRNSTPVAYTRPGVPGTDSAPLLAFLAIVALPPLVAGGLTLWRRRRA